jgi:hypothetical protein
VSQKVTGTAMKSASEARLLARARKSSPQALMGQTVMGQLGQRLSVLELLLRAAFGRALSVPKPVSFLLLRVYLHLVRRGCQDS